MERIDTACTNRGEGKEGRRMEIEIVVPDLGESITEATVSAWLKSSVSTKVARFVPW